MKFIRHTLFNKKLLFYLIASNSLIYLEIKTITILERRTIEAINKTITKKMI